MGGYQRLTGISEHQTQQIVILDCHLWKNMSVWV